MSLNYKVIYYFVLFSILFILYRNSWLPGSDFLISREVYILLVLFIFLFVVVLDFKYIYKPIKLNKETFLFLILCFYVIVSTLIFNSQELTTPYYLVRFVVLCFYILFFLILFPRMLIKYYYIIKFVKFIIVLSTLTSLFGILLYMLNINPIQNFEEFNISYSIHPNYISCLYLVGLSSTLFYFFYEKDTLGLLKKIFILLIFFIQFITLLTTFSRSGILGAFFSLIIFFLLLSRVKFVFIILPSLIISVPIILTLFQAKGFISLLSRYNLLIPAFNMINESSMRMLFGYGITNSFEVYETYKYNTFIVEEQNINNPHNSFLSLVLMFGLIFAIIILIVLFCYLTKAFILSLKERRKKPKLLLAYLVSVIIGILMLSLFESQLVQPEFYSIQFFLIFCGILYLTLKNSHFQKNEI